jgi:hypothetical protein
MTTATQGKGEREYIFSDKELNELRHAEMYHGVINLAQVLEKKIH